MSKSLTWIVCRADCNFVEAEFTEVIGTLDQVKSHLMQRIKQDRQEKKDDYTFEYGTTDISEIEENEDGSLVAQNAYDVDCDCPYVVMFSAKPEILIKQICL
jgi:hypothetical protein